MRRFWIPIVFMFGVSAPTCAQTWEAAGTLPTGGTARQFVAAVNAGGVVYAIGGTPWQNGGDQDGVVHRFIGGQWQGVAPLDGLGPVISQAAGVDSLGRIIIYGGFILGDGGPGEAKVYDPVQGPNTNIAERRSPESAVGYFAFAVDGGTALRLRGRPRCGRT